MYHARGIISTAQAASGEQQKEIEALNKGDEKTKVWAENWYDGLTYCESMRILASGILTNTSEKAPGTLSDNDLQKKESSRPLQHWQKTRSM